MEEKSRLELLRELVETNPAEPFARYGLAMELSNYGDPSEAWGQFEYLLTHHADYCPTYYQAGLFLIRQGRKEEAQKILEKGIEVSGRQGNLHAQGELQAALDELIKKL